MISPVKIQENTNGSLQDLVTVSDIVDYGSNANGYYVRFADGTQICWGRTPELSLQFNAYGSIFQAPYTLTCSAKFANTYISCAASVTLGTGAPWANVQTPGVSSIPLRVFDIVDRTNSIETVFRWIAIGRWK